MRVASLHIHPVKGARAVACNAAQVTARGLDHDRRWLVTDEANRFITQRECAGLARLTVRVSDHGLHMEFGAAIIDVETPAGADRRAVAVWNDRVEAMFAGEEAAAWLFSALGRKARLFYMDDDAARLTSGRWAPAAPVSFADAYPLLIATAASLGALNEEITSSGGAPVPMERFRPNVVIEGGQPWAEDRWRAIQIGGVVYDLVKPCDRCLVTTIDQASGEKTGREPLKTLSRIRTSAHPDVAGVLFGWNAIPRTTGEIKAGDDVAIIEHRAEGWPLQSR